MHYSTLKIRYYSNLPNLSIIETFIKYNDGVKCSLDRTLHSVMHGH